MIVPILTKAAQVQVLEEVSKEVSKLFLDSAWAPETVRYEVLSIIWTKIRELQKRT